MHFCSLSKSRTLHGVDHNGLSLEYPEYGIVNYNEWIDNVSRYLFLYFHSILLTHSVQRRTVKAFIVVPQPVKTFYSCITFPFSLIH